MEKNTELHRALENTKTLALIDKRQGKIWASVMLNDLETVLDYADKQLAKPEEYEYAIRWTHRPSGTTGRLGGFGPESDGWADLDETQLELSDQLGRDRDNGVEADFSYTLLRRRLPGEVEVYDGGILELDGSHRWK